MHNNINNESRRGGLNILYPNFLTCGGLLQQQQQQLHPNNLRSQLDETSGRRVCERGLKKYMSRRLMQPWTLQQKAESSTQKKCSYTIPNNLIEIDHNQTQIFLQKHYKHGRNTFRKITIGLVKSPQSSVSCPFPYISLILRFSFSYRWQFKIVSDKFLK